MLEVNSTHCGNPLLGVLCGLWQSVDMVQYVLTLLNKHRFDLLLYPFTSRNTLLVGADLISFLPSLGFSCVTTCLPTTANGTVILLFLGLNSADLTVLSNSVFFFPSKIVTEHLA